ncbi:MAG: hypothetical protein ACPGXZ_02030 [Saprospiraceae bacterium]
MNKTHLVKIMQTLDGKELKNFEEWVFSPFFNKNEKLKTLCKAILKYAPDFNHPHFTKEKLYYKVTKKEKYSSASFNNLVSDLLQLLFQFLSYQNFQKTSEFSTICLMNELFSKGLNDSMQKIGKRFLNKKEKKGVQNSSYFFDKYLYHKQMDELFLTKASRDFDANLQLKNDELDIFYLATKLKIASDMASRNLVVKGNYECFFMEELLERIEKNAERYQSYPAISVYYNVLQTMNNEEEEHFYFELKDILAANLSVFPKEELRILYDYARNYCIRKINKGNSDYYQEILYLYQFLLEKQIIFKNGYLTQWDYKNIVTAGVRLNLFDWTEDFIEKYRAKLPPKEQENAYIYNLASYNYERKNFKKSLLLLHEVRFTDSSYYIGAKVIQLKSYYELEEADAFYALIEAFRIYIIRNKTLSDLRKRANLNFLKLAQKTFQLRDDQFALSKKAIKEKSEKLLHQIKTTSPLMNKNWLVEECEMIK